MYRRLKYYRRLKCFSLSFNKIFRLETQKRPKIGKCGEHQCSFARLSIAQPTKSQQSNTDNNKLIHILNWIMIMKVWNEKNSNSFFIQPISTAPAMEGGLAFKLKWNEIQIHRGANEKWSRFRKTCFVVKGFHIFFSVEATPCWRRENSNHKLKTYWH